MTLIWAVIFEVRVVWTKPNP